MILDTWTLQFKSKSWTNLAPYSHSYLLWVGFALLGGRLLKLESTAFLGSFMGFPPLFTLCKFMISIFPLCIANNFLDWKEICWWFEMILYEEWNMNMRIEIMLNIVSMIFQYKIFISREIMVVFWVLLIRFKIRFIWD